MFSSAQGVLVIQLTRQLIQIGDEQQGENELFGGILIIECGLFSSFY